MSPKKSFPNFMFSKTKGKKKSRILKTLRTPNLSSDLLIRRSSDFVLRDF